MTQPDYIRVRQVMTSAPRFVDGLASAREAIELMRADNVSSLVIDRRHDGDEYGVVTVQDIAAEVIARNRSLERTSVYEIMSKPVLTLDVEMDVKYAIRILTRFKLTRALVTEQGKMVGIVTLRDMAVRYIDPPLNGG
jgi:signal-transduction protein with cAMP-binding, CBS, and nucleotidyltransferase domain